MTALAVLAAPPGPAGARTADSPAAPSAWATINICDTGTHPDAVGVRGRMAGVGAPDVTLRMRFRLQYRQGGQWVPVRRADSRWVTTGAGDQRYAEAGHTFMVTAPRPGQAFVIRGQVMFEWVAGDGLVVDSVQRQTRGGHAGTLGADPSTSSAATCAVH